ncbi:MAG: Asp-tRNA(Asn)/Glu-tRNA(Gln) amidotransferase subunit GatB [Deltaproteobacteria bacterium]|nr:Asp-tRNA(Asn)/Glu-tRNA(Gln) amidotransferase subunit GatB [Deltaproteobacteria bacterium]
MEYDTIIGFETHVELKTKTKLFCDCLVDSEAPPNTQICPVCTGQPGALPVLNKRAVEYTIKAGLALHCTINRHARFARKNYFYPDSPKGYQISQYERPFCENGFLEIIDDHDQPYAVGIKRIHLEEDAGKLVHSTASFEESEYSLVDYNRSSVPLLEIVTDHERNPLRSINEAKAYLEKLRQILIYTGISDCVIERGQFRCDVNISIRAKGSSEFGNRSEIKNMASFRFIMDALEHEAKRQQGVLRSGKSLPQETRLFDEEKRITLPMRSKEDAPDYRYFPDPDLVELEIDQAFVEKIQETLPELPDQKVDRITEYYGIPKKDVLVLTKDKAVSDFFESCAEYCGDRKRLCNWIIKDLFKLLKEASVSTIDCPIRPKDFSTLINMLAKGEITDQIGRTVLEIMFETRQQPEAIIEQQGLRPIQNTESLETVLNGVIEENPDIAVHIREGKTKPIDFLIGQVMRKTSGKANPKRVRELIQKKLK